MTIKIAVAGHTNTGKTTLIRTVMRQTIGEVEDAANVTKVGRLYYYQGLQANFIDTPGFQYPSIALDYLDNHPLSSRNQNKVKFDLDAINSIKQSHVVLYVGNLSIAPDDTHKDEVEVVLKSNPRVIGILNQYHRNLQGSSTTKIDNRCNQWIQLFNDQNINDVIIFDAHWDNRNKEQQIYDSVCRILDDSLRADFIDGLNKFRERQKQIRQEVYSVLAKSIEDLQMFRIKTPKNQYKIDENNEGKNSEYQQKIGREIYKETVGFIAFVSDLFEVAAEYPTDSTSSLLLKTQERINITGRLATGASASTLFGTIAAVIGGIVGGAITGVLSGGLGIIPGAIEGAKIFGAVGASLGVFAVLSDSDDQIEIGMTSEQLEDCFENFIAIIWGLQHNGYGRNQDLSNREIQNIKNKIKELTNHLSLSTDWRTVKYQNILGYCDQIFTVLEKPN